MRQAFRFILLALLCAVFPGLALISHAATWGVGLLTVVWTCVFLAKLAGNGEPADAPRVGHGWLKPVSPPKNRDPVTELVATNWPRDDWNDLPNHRFDALQSALLAYFRAPSHDSSDDLASLSQLEAELTACLLDPAPLPEPPPPVIPPCDPGHAIPTETMSVAPHLRDAFIPRWKKSEKNMRVHKRSHEVARRHASFTVCPSCDGWGKLSSFPHSHVCVRCSHCDGAGYIRRYPARGSRYPTTASFSLRGTDVVCDLCHTVQSGDTVLHDPSCPSYQELAPLAPHWPECPDCDYVWVTTDQSSYHEKILSAPCPIHRQLPSHQ